MGFPYTSSMARVRPKDCPAATVVGGGVVTANWVTEPALTVSEAVTDVSPAAAAVRVNVPALVGARAGNVACPEAAVTETGSNAAAVADRVTVGVDETGLP